MPFTTQHNFVSRAGQPPSATVAYQGATRRVTAARRTRPPSPAAQGLYRTDTALAKNAQWPVRAIRIWIVKGYIKPLLYRGKLYYSIKSVRDFVGRHLRDWPRYRWFFEKSVGARLSYDPRTKILRKVGSLPSLPR